MAKITNYIQVATPGKKMKKKTFLLIRFNCPEKKQMQEEDIGMTDLSKFTSLFHSSKNKYLSISPMNSMALHFEDLEKYMQIIFFFFQKDVV